jgi:hypothetical protein
MDDLLNPLQSLEEERTLLTQCLDALEATRVAVERADLAGATAILAARYENVLADAFYPQIVDALGTLSAVDQAEALMAEVRTAIAAVRADVRGLAPINAHLSDPEGLEADIDAMTASLRCLLDFEDIELAKLIDQLPPDAVGELRSRIESVSTHQTSLPDPPDNGLIRKLAEVKESIGLSLHDHSTTWHPGVDGLLDGEN